MTKAERIYRDTRIECKDHVKAWGKPEGGFTGLVYKETESISTRTVNAVEKLLKRAEDGLELDIKLGVGTEERNQIEAWTLWMVRKTLENSRAALAV